MADKAALYLLPGLLCDETVWRHQVDHLSAIAAVTVPDYRDCDAIPDMAARVLEQAPSRFAVAGHSLGGRVALEIVRAAPERVTRLALLDTATGPARDSEYEKSTGWVELARTDQLRRFDGLLVPVGSGRRIETKWG